jgi:hypothetical protein
MADFSQDKKYNFIWQSSKFEGLLFIGDNISSLVNDAGYVTSSISVSSSYALNSTYAATSSYFSGSISNAISASYALTASYVSGSISNAISASYALTSSYVKNAQTASYVLNAVSASYATTASYYKETDPIFTAKSASFATTASNNFIGTQSIDGNVIVGATTFITSSTTTPKLQLSAGTSSVKSIAVTSTPLVIESDSTTTLAIFSPDSRSSQIQFGTPSDIFGALLAWDYPNRNLILSTATNNNSGKIILQTGTGNEVARFTDTVISLTGSIQVTGSITSSLFGTASWAQNALTASYIANMSSSVIQTLGSTLYSINPPTSNFNSTNSILLGNGAGSSSAAAIGLISIGRDSGRNASNSQYSIFIGDSAGGLATDAIYSIFLGNGAGVGGYKAELSNFMGFQTGLGAYSASYSNLIGYRAGASGSIGTIGTNNIIIGTNISLPNNRRDSINIGGIIFGTGSYFGNIGGDPYTGSQANGRIGIGTVNPNATLDVAGNTIITGSVISTLGFTGSLNGTSSWANNALTASYVTNLNQPVTIGNITGTPSNENTLNIYPPLAGGTGEGGQILLAASGGLYTSASMIDTWQDQFRILRGSNTGGSNAGLVYVNLQSGNTQFIGAVTASAYSGLPNSWMHGLRSGNQTIVSGTWANRDIIFNDVSSNNFTYNSSTGIATLKAGKTYRITARLAWAAAAVYVLQFRVYNQTTSAFIGPTAEMIQSTNGTNNISDNTLEHIFAVGASDADISIRTTNITNALTGEYIRGDLNTQLIIQQIA